MLDQDPKRKRQLWKKLKQVKAICLSGNLKKRGVDGKTKQEVEKGWLKVKFVMTVLCGVSIMQ